MRIPVIGLTGQTGAGKSTVAGMLKQRGYCVIDADAVARSVMAPGSPVLDSLAEAFGRAVIKSDGSLDRAALAKAAFASREATLKLNAVTHPPIDREIRKRIRAAARQGAGAVVLDAAALLESPSAKRCDYIAVVCAQEQLRLERIVKRDGLTVEQARRRIGAQMPALEYLLAADIIILAGPPFDLEEQVNRLAAMIDAVAVKNERAQTPGDKENEDE
ncbi:MAG TPA: dephospho-CoA kinase [Clostridiales bacterium]|nr:MAG: Dephospho-CoA kinase [Firmicutes bacterium ADurb.Bin262]HOU10451.1 dephospho-CoA kinase [Clostridiales bacterium]HQH62618.1 dephospho-CoA kinase [Clostridiales bacterium]HQK72365.1 dephospho-CoA kinase [Clostridiales bacterium]